VWQDTRIETASATFRNVFTGETLNAPLELSEVFAQFPVALLINGKG
jgi:maltooligosyltrehalose synthase